VDPAKTAIMLVERRNGVTTEGGTLHRAVPDGDADWSAAR